MAGVMYLEELQEVVGPRGGSPDRDGHARGLGDARVIYAK